MTNKQIVNIIINAPEFDEIVYGLQDDKKGLKVLDECNWEYDELMYWADDNS